MTFFVYDGSFPGLLSTVFEIFERKCVDAFITRSFNDQDLFAEKIKVFTDHQKAERIVKWLGKLFTRKTLQQIYWSCLSEINGIENDILELIRYAHVSGQPVDKNFGHAAVLEVAQTARKVGREKHRFEAFVRFELITQNLYYATIAPDFNVLPLIAPHFKRRYAAQDWLIYDSRRKYGIHYNQQNESLEETTMDFSPAEGLLPTSTVPDQDEGRYKDLWRNYFKSVNIAARKNTRLHLQHLPRRYWKYLVEKNHEL